MRKEEEVWRVFEHSKPQQPGRGDGLLLNDGRALLHNGLLELH